MWETINNVLTSSNAATVLIFIAFVVLTLAILFKTGLLRVSTKYVQIGAADKEREIIRQQVEWVKLHCSGMEATIPRFEGYDIWKGRFIAEAVFDEYVDWITFNHLSTSSSYIEIKQDRIVNLVMHYITSEKLKTKDFEMLLRKDTEEAIKKLIQIREVYEKHMLGKA